MRAYGVNFVLLIDILYILMMIPSIEFREDKSTLF